jgi:hypothetical protein
VTSEPNINTEDGPVRTETRLFVDEIKCKEADGLCDFV